MRFVDWSTITEADIRQVKERFEDFALYINQAYKYGIIGDIIVKTVDECSKGLTEEERISFYRSLKVIVSNLSEYAESFDSDTENQN